MRSVADLRRDGRAGGLEGLLAGLKAERNGEVGASGDARETDFIQRAF